MEGSGEVVGLTQDRISLLGLSRSRVSLTRRWREDGGGFRRRVVGQVTSWIVRGSGLVLARAAELTEEKTATEVGQPPLRSPQERRRARGAAVALGGTREEEWGGGWRWDRDTGSYGSQGRRRYGTVRRRHFVVGTVW